MGALRPLLAGLPYGLARTFCALRRWAQIARGRERPGSSILVRVTYDRIKRKPAMRGVGAGRASRFARSRVLLSGRALVPALAEAVVEFRSVASPPTKWVEGKGYPTKPSGAGPFPVVA